MSAAYLGSVVFPGVASINLLLHYYYIIPTKVESPFESRHSPTPAYCFRVSVKRAQKQPHASQHRSAPSVERPSIRSPR